MATFDPATITAAILAGGAGSRLDGRDKGLEPLAGRPLIAYVVAALSGQAGALLISANRNPERYAEYGSVCRDTLAGFNGPLAGISAALAACTTDWLLTLPVDCPCPPADLSRRLHAAVGSTTRAAVAHDGARRQPLFALYRRDLATAAAEGLARALPVWRWQDDIGAAGVDFADARPAFENLNSVEEFRRWEHTHHG